MSIALEIPYNGCTALARNKADPKNFDMRDPIDNTFWSWLVFNMSMQKEYFSTLIGDKPINYFLVADISQHREKLLALLKINIVHSGNDTFCQECVKEMMDCAALVGNDGRAILFNTDVYMHMKGIVGINFGLHTRDVNFYEKFAKIMDEISEQPIINVHLIQINPNVYRINDYLHFCLKGIKPSYATKDEITIISGVIFKYCFVKQPNERVFLRTLIQHISQIGEKYIIGVIEKNENDYRLIQNTPVFMYCNWLKKICNIIHSFDITGDDFYNSIYFYQLAIQIVLSCEIRNGICAPIHIVNPTFIDTLVKNNTLVGNQTSAPGFNGAFSNVKI